MPDEDINPETRVGDGITVSANLCAAIRALARSGRTTRDITFMLELNHNTVKYHRRGECSHDPARMRSALQPIQGSVADHELEETLERFEAIDRRRERLGVGETKLSEAIGCAKSYWSNAKTQGATEEKLDLANGALEYYSFMGRLPDGPDQITNGALITGD